MIKKVYIESKCSYPTDRFARKVIRILNDEKGWCRCGLQFVQINDEKKADLKYYLTTNSFIKNTCKFNKLSCAYLGKGVCFINRYNWVNIPKKSKMDRNVYHKYVINHETGHMFGLRHQTKNPNKINSPVMVPQTLGQKFGCRPCPYPSNNEIKNVKRIYIKE
jgi:predicted Zn-dependent protease